jgi:hypothetical protein
MEKARLRAPFLLFAASTSHSATLLYLKTDCVLSRRTVVTDCLTCSAMVAYSTNHFRRAALRGVVHSVKLVLNAAPRII